jgi:hypothetical protein
VNAVTSILIISRPQVPHFGGVKHWFPSMVFLGILAGAAVTRGGAALWDVLKAKRPTLSFAVVAAPVFVVLLTPALVYSARVFPNGTAAYSELAGGLPGAVTLGMQRQFWSSHVTGVPPWINAHAKPGARLLLHDVHNGSFRDYQRNGMLRNDWRPVGSPFDANIVAYQYHQEFREQERITCLGLYRAEEIGRATTKVGVIPACLASRAWGEAGRPTSLCAEILVGTAVGAPVLAVPPLVHVTQRMRTLRTKLRGQLLFHRVAYARHAAKQAFQGATR